MTTATLETPIATGSVIVNRELLVDGLEMIVGVVKRRTPKPVLQCVLLTAADGSLGMMATSLDTCVRTSTAEVQVEQPFVAAVHCERLLSLLREMGDHTVTLGFDGNKLAVRGESASFKLATEDAATMPPFPTAKPEPAVTLPGADLLRLFQHTRPATDPTNSTYPAAHVYAEKGKLTIAATEGRVCGEAIAACLPVAASFVAEFPVSVMPLAERAIGDSNEVTIGVSDNLVVIQAGDTYFASTQIEAKFPPYRDFIPKDLDKAANVAPTEFLAVIRQASMLIGNIGASAAVVFQFAKGKGCELRSESEVGSSSIAFPCKYDGEEITIGFNPKFLSAALRVMEVESVVVEMVAPNRPAVIRCGPNLMYFVMPVNIRS